MEEFNDYRAILHVDINCFYAAVECFLHPEIRRFPVAVCGDTAQRHGIVLAKNEIAKKYGIKTGEAIWEAREKCPKLLTIPAHYDLYIRFSKAARKIYERYTDLIESYGLDECWLDITGCTRLLGSPLKIAQEISQAVKTELGITVSIGLSWNKIYAKLGSDYRKPDAITVFSRENYKEKIWPLPASDLLYVGRSHEKKLGNYGIRTIGQLAETDPDFLSRTMGKWGEYLWAFASGHDVSPVNPKEPPIKSVGHSMTTYRDVDSYEEAWMVIVSQAEDVARKLRANGFRCRTVQMSVRFADLFWVERQIKLNQPSCVTREIAGAAMQLFRANVNFNKFVRAIGVRACDLVSLDGGYQIDFFGDTERQVRWEKIESCVDDLCRRFGSKAVTRAVLLNADILGESDPLTHIVHPVAYFK